jgi:ABC-2 type transport system ATP-binding protein
MLRVKKLTKMYNGNLVLNEISLSMGTGETIGLIGPNGSGKSTLLNLISGTISPTYGEIECDRKRISAAISRNGFINDMSVFNNIQMFIALSGSSKDWLDTILTGLKVDFLNMQVSDLSTGMKQKLSLLVAFLDFRDLILLDEPFAHLDQPSIQFLTRIIDQAKKLGKSFIVTSHTFEHLGLLCDRVIFINHGQILKDSMISDLLLEYNSIEAAYKHLLS